jgi:nucleoside-diphosphate-sugar epimerase
VIDVTQPNGSPAAGNVGSAIISALEENFTVVGLDLEGKKARCELYSVDLAAPDSVTLY